MRSNLARSFSLISAVLVGLILIMLIPAGFRYLFSLTKTYKLLNSDSLIEENISLKKENLDLKAEIYSMRKSFVLPAKNNLLETKVYSVYPFNTKQRLFISVGETDGVEVNDAVLFSESSFIGKVINVSNHKSEVMTIFDPDFSMPVRIGSDEIDALLNGGVNPYIKLIDKNNKISIGDKVVSSSKNFPYGLILGSISSIKNDSSGAFSQSNISLPYSIGDVRNVFVVRGYNK